MWVRRRLLFVLAWTAATAVSVGGSWVGLQPVLQAATGDRPQVLSASQLHRAANAAPTTTAQVSPSPTPVSVSPTPVPGSPSPTASGDESMWRRLPGVEAYERTFALRGGEVVVLASRAEVRVVSATPAEGFTDSVTRWSANSVRISFNSPNHTSRVWVTWRNGPYAEVTETA